MIEIFAFVLMALGIYLILSGLIEKPEIIHRERIPRQEIGWDYEKEKEYEEWEKKEERSKIKGGGVILIGPIPIIFGESRYAVYALILAIVLMILSILFLASLR